MRSAEDQERRLEYPLQEVGSSAIDSFWEGAGASIRPELNPVNELLERLRTTDGSHDALEDVGFHLCRKSTKGTLQRLLTFLREARASPGFETASELQGCQTVE